jgi:hypothetical protein
MALSKKIVFFFPAFASTEATAPLSLLAVATPLLRSGYQVTIVDSTITPNFKQRVLDEVKDALCLGARLLQKSLSYPARWRLDHDFYAFPFELAMNRKLKRYVSVAKPTVDAKQLEPAVGAACP